MDQPIKSPINYTGNKYRLLEQFRQFFPKKTGVFIDLFCGGATVGFNVDAEKIVLIDNNRRVIGLLDFLAKENISDIIAGIETNIARYDLSYSRKNTYKYYRDNGYVIGNNGLKEYNKNGYLKLRSDYNDLVDKDSFDANIKLYTLMAYAFNNDIRFNRDGLFNLPVGKTDFNNNNYNKLIAYNDRAKKINYEFICGDFKDPSIQSKILEANFVYCDPPYLITDAVYNEQNGWNTDDEKSLLNLLDNVDKKGISFALSNVLQKKGAENSILKKWLEENGHTKNNIIYHYRSSSYNKKARDAAEEEVLITNRRPDVTTNQ